ncbi:hypothetical protein [Sphingobacterium sp.]|uniref:hypothetical protein n=1 Tax=Sphingobacterium sp. TaxID=341027 RepID=UPI002897940E|nr:hypothetical protein [Sphingobacterium sp.]
MENNMYLNHKKKLIFGSPSNYGFSDAIKSELSILGYEVIDFSTLNTTFQYPSLFHRIYNVYRKIVFSDKSYKAKLKQRYISQNLCDMLSKIENVDFSFIIRPDLFPLEFISQLSNKSNYTIAYQWDGIQRYPDIIKYISLFDRFLAFEDNNTSKNISICTNFYLEKIISDQKITIENKAFLLATFQKNRIKETLRLKQILDEIKFNSQFILYCDEKECQKTLKDSGISIIKKPISYFDSLKMTLQSTVLIDIHNPIHNGLSFRIFEALGYEKKLITTNKEVAKYDFYDPRNILIWENQCADEIEKFCTAAYHQIDSRIKEKYALENWIKHYSS